VSAVSIIIVNWNGKSFLADCLDGLKRQTYGNFSVIMVDNGSVDGSLDYVQTHYPEVKTIALSENSGFAVANNIAIESVKTKYVALLNNDAVPHPDWLQNLMDALENHPEAGFCASKMLFYDSPGVIDRAGDVYTTAATAL
jgi:GT2 family glycosyltransferase